MIHIERIKEITEDLKAKNCVSSYYTDILFFSCRSLSIEKGLTDISDEEASLRKIMIENTKKAILLIDSNKFGTTSFCRVSGIDNATNCMD